MAVLQQCEKYATLLHALVNNVLELMVMFYNDAIWQICIAWYQYSLLDSTIQHKEKWLCCNNVRSMRLCCMHLSTMYWS
jgi:hypothetical protein